VRAAYADNIAAVEGKDGLLHCHQYFFYLYCTTLKVKNMSSQNLWFSKIFYKGKVTRQETP
jgi:hypothetical protein